MARLLYSPAEARKSDDETIINSIQGLADIIKERNLNSESFDIEKVCMNIMGKDEIYTNPRSIKDVYLLNNSLVAIPGVLPINNGSARLDGAHVVPVIQLPDGRAYPAYIPGTPTHVVSYKHTLVRPRAVHVHSVIPGMIVSYHHYNTRKGDSTKQNIYAIKLYYQNGKLVAEKVDKSVAMINIPAPEDVERDDVI